jgi:D-alanyl-D-alanine carboxypeptidase
MAQGHSVAVQVIDIAKALLAAAETDGLAPESLPAVSAWVSGDAADWTASQVASSGPVLAAFLRSSPDVRTCLESGAAAMDLRMGEEGAPPQEMAGVLQAITAHWAEADLATGEDATSPTCQALIKASKQIPMVMAVQQTLGLFPPAMAAKLDQQAAKVGADLRDKATQGATPADLMASVMGNPMFMEMMKDVMEEPGPAHGDDEEARALHTRLRLIETRLAALERKSAAGNAGNAGSAKGSSSKGKKKKGGGRTSSPPRY